MLVLSHAELSSQMPAPVEAGSCPRLLGPGGGVRGASSAANPPSSLWCWCPGPTPARLRPLGAQDETAPGPNGGGGRDRPGDGPRFRVPRLIWGDGRGDTFRGTEP